MIHWEVVKIFDRSTGKYVDGQSKQTIRKAIFDNDVDVRFNGKSYMGSFGINQLESDLKILNKKKPKKMAKKKKFKPRSLGKKTKLVPVLVFTKKNGKKFKRAFKSKTTATKAKRAYMSKGGPRPSMFGLVSTFKAKQINKKR